MKISYDIEEDGTLDDAYYLQYLYDAQGRITEMYIYSDSSRYFYYNGKGFISKNIDFDTVSEYTYEIDENSNLVSNYRLADQEIVERFDYEYDLYNRITKEVCYDYDYGEQDIVLETLMYTYDEYGNVSSIISEIYNEDLDRYDVTKTNYYNDNNNLHLINNEDDGEFNYTVFVYTKNPEAFTVQYG